MDVPTITEIRELRDNIRTLLPTIKPRDFTDQNYGKEQEYSIQGLKGGIDALLTDISTLTGGPKRFIKESIHAERIAITNALTGIHDSLSSNSFEQTAAHVDQLKPLIRRFRLRHTDERQDLLDERIDKLQRLITDFEEKTNDIEGFHRDSSEQYSRIKSLFEVLDKLNIETDETLDNLNDKLDVLEELRSTVTSLLEKDQERSESIHELLSDSKEHASEIKSFSEKVSQRELQLEDQEVKTVDYLTHLEGYKTERDDLNGKASKLIQQAREALGYTTATGISAAFDTYHTNAKDDPSTERWLRIATLFIVCAGLIGVWIFYDQNVGTNAIIGRLSLIPIFLAGAWFSASQYVKQRNIAEDYGYKSVLSRSLVGFSDQLSNCSTKGDDHSHYIRSVLGEIHKDPLRKHVTCPSKMKDIIDDVKDIAGEIKNLKSPMVKATNHLDE